MRNAIFKLEVGHNEHGGTYAPVSKGNNDEIIIHTKDAKYFHPGEEPPYGWIGIPPDFNF